MSGSGRTSSGWIGSTIRSILAAPTRSIARSARSIRASPTARSSPAYAGIRPRICGPDEPAADFLIQGPRDHGIPHLVNLFGIESPGLTSSLAIGEYVATLLGLAAPMPKLAMRAAE